MRWNIVIHSKGSDGSWGEEPAVQVDAPTSAAAWQRGEEIAGQRHHESRVAHVFVASEPFSMTGVLEPLTNRDPGDETGRP